MREGMKGKRSFLRSLLLAVAALGILGLPAVVPPGFGGWRLESRLEIPFEGHRRSVTALAIGPPFSRGEGRFLASASEDGTIHLWRLPLGRREAVFFPGSIPSVLTFSADGATLIAGDIAGRLHAWRLSEGADDLEALPLRAASPSALSPVTALRFASSGARLAAGYEDGRVEIFESLEALPHRLRAAREGGILALAFSRDSRSLAAADSEGVTTVWNLDTGDRRTLSSPAASLALAFVVDGALATTDGRRVSLWPGSGAAAEQEPQLLEFEGEALVALSATAEGEFRALDSRGALLEWAFDDESPPRWLRAPGGRFSRLALAPDGLAVGGGRDGSVRFWSESRPARLLGATPLALGASPNSRQVAVSYGVGAHGAGSVRVRASETGELVGSFEAPDFVATCVTFGGEGQDAWLGSWNRGESRSWPLSSGSSGAEARRGPPPKGPDHCPPSHDRRFTVTALDQALGREVFLEDTRTGILVPLSAGYRRVVDLPRRSLGDVLFGRFHFAGIRNSGALEFASCRPRYPLLLVEAGLLLLALGPGTAVRLVRRLYRNSPGR